AAKVQRETKVLCRNCGLSTVGKARRYVARLGYLGVGVIAASMGQWRNGQTARALERFAEPYARRPGVMTPEGRPRRPGWRVPATVRLVIAVAVVAVLLVVAAAH